MRFFLNWPFLKNRKKVKPRYFIDPVLSYELYWAWSLQYDPNNWFMLIDSRDTFFQTDSFASLERTKGDVLEDGLLYFFGVS